MCTGSSLALDGPWMAGLVLRCVHVVCSVGRGLTFGVDRGRQMTSVDWVEGVALIADGRERYRRVEAAYMAGWIEQHAR